MISDIIASHQSHFPVLHYCFVTHKANHGEYLSFDSAISMKELSCEEASVLHSYAVNFELRAEMKAR